MFLVIFTKEPPWQVNDISKPKQSNSVRSFELRGKDMVIIDSFIIESLQKNSGHYYQEIISQLYIWFLP